MSAHLPLAPTDADRQRGLWLGLLGVAVFGTFPDAPALAGMAIIVVTGVRMALMRRRPAA